MRSVIFSRLGPSSQDWISLFTSPALAQIVAAIHAYLLDSILMGNNYTLTLFTIAAGKHTAGPAGNQEEGLENSAKQASR